MRFPMSPRWTSYVVPKPPKGGSKTQKCLSCDISETVRIVVIRESGLTIIELELELELDRMIVTINH